MNTIEVEVEGIECPFCGEKFFSRYGHDFRYCGCGYCFVDGGPNYLRYGWGVGSNHVANLAGQPRMVKMKAYKILYTEQELEEQRYKRIYIAMAGGAI